LYKYNTYLFLACAVIEVLPPVIDGRKDQKGLDNCGESHIFVEALPRPPSRL
jgi:hypothetical protein